MAGFQLAPNMQAAYDCTKTSSQDEMLFKNQALSILFLQNINLCSPSSSGRHNCQPQEDVSAIPRYSSAAAKLCGFRLLLIRRDVSPVQNHFADASSTKSFAAPSKITDISDILLFDLLKLRLRTLSIQILLISSSPITQLYRRL